MPAPAARESRIPPRVAIVGGGPGGLFTAWHLERLTAGPLAVTILEASGRLGGKVLTPAFTAAPVRYEAGAAELYDYSPVDDDPLRAIVRELGLSTVPLAGSTVSLAGHDIANLDDLGGSLGDAARREVEAFDNWARAAMTPREFYESGSDHASPPALPGSFAAAMGRIRSPAARRYVETMIHSDLATEPGRTSTPYGLQNYLMNDPAYMRLYRIAGGNERLIRALAARLAAEVRLESPVTSVDGPPGGPLEVTWLDAGRPRSERFDVVVLALPIGPLAAIRYGQSALAAAMARHIVHHDHPAHYLRVTLLFDRPLAAAPGDDDFLMLDAFGGACLYIESGRDPIARHGVLGWLLGGETAREMAALDDARIAAAAVESLPAPLAGCRERLLEARVHRWNGAVSALPGGWQPLPVDRRHRPAATHPNLLVVGDYLFDSTLNGALDSAEHVAGWVAADLASGRPAGRRGILGPAGAAP